MRLPELKDLPGEDALLEEYGQFIDKFNPTEHFHQIWGGDYFDKVSDLWQSQIKLFKENRTPEGTVVELLMVLTFDYILGPNIGVPMERKLVFFKWLLSSVKDNG